MTLGAKPDREHVHRVQLATEGTRYTDHAKAEWIPASRDRVRVARTVDVAASEVEKALRIRPEQIASVVYRSKLAAGDGATVTLTPAKSHKWLRVPARIDFLTPPNSRVGATISLRWHAHWLARYFPVMEADVFAHGTGHMTELVLKGTYRPPLGFIGLLFDRLVGRWVATATAERFVEGLADSLRTSQPTPHVDHGKGVPSWQ